jgi:hypothetical protein
MMVVDQLQQRVNSHDYSTVKHPVMANQRILVTYTAPTLFQTSESWKRIRETLLSQLPLQSAHWKPTSRPGLRTIRELDIGLEPLDTLRDELTSQIPVTVLEKPLLHIYIVTCEVSFTIVIIRINLHLCVCQGIRHRAVQELSEEANKGMAYSRRATETPGMVDIACSQTGLENANW